MALNLFLIWTFILYGRPQDFFPFLIPLRLAFVTTILLVSVTVFCSKFSGLRGVVEFGQVRKIIAIYIIMIIGVPFSMHRGKSFDFVFMQYSIQIVFFLLSIIYINSQEKLEKFLFVICLSAFFYACFSLIKSDSFSGRFAFGTMYDPNDLAAFLVALFPLNLYFLSGGGAFGKKVVSLAAIGVSIALILMTGSRGGFLGLIVVLCLLFFTKLGPLKRLHKAVLLGILVVAIGTNYEKIDAERYNSIFNLEQDYNVSSEEGRLAIWKRGWELTLQHPVTGVGTHSFAMAIGYYREKIGEIPKWQTAHNAFILFLTEVGFIGFIVYLSLIFTSLKIFFNYSKEEAFPERFQSISKMSKVILLSFLGHLICSSFLSNAYSGIFTLFFGFSVVLQNIISSEEKYSNHHSQNLFEARN